MSMVARSCERCGYMASGKVCKACLLLEGLETGDAALGVTGRRPRKEKGGPTTTREKEKEKKEKKEEEEEEEEEDKEDKAEEAEDVEREEEEYT